MAPHSSVLAWRIPGTGEPGGLPSMGSHKVGHDCSDLAAAATATLVLAQLTFLIMRPKSLHSFAPLFCLLLHNFFFAFAHRNFFILNLILIFIFNYWFLFFLWSMHSSLNLLFVVFKLLIHVWLFATVWTAANQAPLFFTVSMCLFKLFTSIPSVMLSSHFILCHPLLLPSTFPSIRIFSRVGSSHQVAKVLELTILLSFISTDFVPSPSFCNAWSHMLVFLIC